MCESVRLCSSAADLSVSPSAFTTAGYYGMNLVFLFLTSMYFVTADLNALLLTLTGLKLQMVNVKVILNPDLFFFFAMHLLSARSSSRHEEFLDTLCLQATV